MERVALFRIIFLRTTYIRAKFHPFSGKQEHNQTNSSGKCIRIIYDFLGVFLYANTPTESRSYAPTFF